MNISSCKEDLMGIARALLSTDSPSGFTHRAADFVENFAQSLGYQVNRNNKGNVTVDLPGREPGHGGATIPAGLSELLIVDMGCVGLNLTCTEYQVSICAKDGNGPYDYDMTTRLVTLAKAGQVDYAVDIYPHYGSDAGVAWHAGHDVRAALIGPGVHASHGMERTHWEALKNTIQLMALYLEC